jgi:hypothetical protein
MVHWTDDDGDFMPHLEAAGLLGVTERTVRNHIRSARLRVAVRGSKRGVLRSDVASLVRTRTSTSKFKVTRRSVQTLERRVGRLVEILRVAIDILDLGCEPLDLCESELVELYRCAGAFSTGAWPPGSERTWAGILLRLSVVDLAAICRKTGDANPWLPFYCLQSEMARTAAGALALILRASERHLFGLIEDWMEKTRGTRAVQVGLRTLGGTPNRALVRLRQRNQTRPGARPR